MKTYILDSDKTVFSVSDITRNIRFTLEKQFADVWVEGELSGFKRHSSGHMYFSLKDDQSQIQCVMFRGENQTLRFEPEDGQSLLCRGRISVYPARGQYQLYVEAMEPKGLGALQLQFEKLKAKLREEGFFDESRKRPIPYLPEAIGIVTSLDGAALRDILTILERRFESAHIVICPVAVQGAGAAQEIASAIEALNEYGRVDVMIVGRGGGSLEDLWAFNEEVVARAIFESRIPVISAVGHEVDYTIADFVADLRAPTPSAAAELVLPEKEELILHITQLRERLILGLGAYLKSMKQEVRRLAESAALKNPLIILEASFQRLDELQKNIHQAFAHFVRYRKEALGSVIGKLEALGPLAVLKRGYSMTMQWPGGRVLDSVRGVKTGDEIKTNLSDGFVISRVIQKGV